MAVLKSPAVFDTPAPLPKKALPIPVVLAVPAPTPAKVFEFGKLTSPVTVKTRLPPRLYCVVALTVFPESVPPAVPLPLMLKLLDACGLAVFWMWLPLPGETPLAGTLSADEAFRLRTA